MHSEDNQGSDDGSFQAARNEVAEKFEGGKQAATEVLHDARDSVKEKVSEYASQAKDAVAEATEGAQQNLSGSLSAFAGAMRAASDHLAGSDQGPVSKLVSDAAGGLERLSTSLKEKSFEDVLDEVRSFGRDNSAAMFAGSIIAGVALARFVKSSAPPATHSPSEPDRPVENWAEQHETRAPSRSDDNWSGQQDTLVPSRPDDPNDGWLDTSVGDKS